MKTILIADTDERVRNIVRLIFEYMGYRVVATGSGVDAILKTKEIKPDIVLADVSLSDKNGYEVSREIKNNLLLKNTPVLLLAASLLAFDKTKAEEAYADDFIIKPFESEEITKKVKFFTSQNKGGVEFLINQSKERKIRFIEAMLVLLVIFMVTVPILYKSIDVNLPKVESKPMPTAKGEKKIVVTVNDKREIFIEKKKYTLSQLKVEIRTLIRSRGKGVGDEDVFLRADADVPYGIVIEVMAEIKKAGVKKVELVTEPVLVFESRQPSEGEVSRKEEIETSQPEKREAPEELKKVELKKEEPLMVKEEKPKKEDEELIKIEAKEEEATKKDISTVPATELDGKYTVQIGAFQTEEKAKEIAESLVSKEYPAFIKTVESPEKGTWHRVRIGTFKTREEAKLYGDNLKNRESLIEAAIVVSETEKKKIKVSQPERREASEELKKVNVKKEIPKLRETSKEELKGSKYVVKKGDSLWRIAKRFNTSVKDLKTTNNLKSDRLNRGKVLVIPQAKHKEGIQIEKKEEKVFAEKRIQAQEESPQPEVIPEDIKRKEIEAIRLEFGNSSRSILGPEDVNVAEASSSEEGKWTQKKGIGYLTGIKITEWSSYIASSGVAIVHHVTIENTSDIAYKDIEVRVRYFSGSYSNARTEVGGETGILPITVPPHSKKTYLKEGAILGAGPGGLYAGGIEVLGAIPVIGGDNKVKLDN